MLTESKTPTLAQEFSLTALSCLGARHRQGGVANHHQSSQHHHCHSHNNQQSASALTFRTTPELHKVIEAIRFIAAHVKNEEDYEEVCSCDNDLMSNFN